MNHQETGETALELFVSAPAGVVDALVDEVRTFGVSRVRARTAGVTCRGDLIAAYRICLWSRFASRVLQRVAVYDASDAEELYTGARTVQWSELFDVAATFAIRATVADAPITHTAFVAQKVKDAVADAFREACGQRPSVDRREPDVRIHVHWHRKRVQLSLDLAGEALHRRGYRAAGGEAPLKENLAAALLHYSGWPAVAERGGSLLDPMCGSGTLLLEGALMAARVAPGLLRERFGFMALRGFEESQWRQLVADAERQQIESPALIGFDIDSRALRVARESAERIGVDQISVSKRSIAVDEAVAAAPGLILSNPPYGERLGNSDLPALYRDFGRLVRSHPDWRAGLFTGNPDLAHRTRLPVTGKRKLFNGALPCVLFDFGEVSATKTPAPVPTPVREVEPDLVNRLTRNIRHLRRWRQRENVSCYRVYDADIPEYAFAIDFYEADEPHVVMQEYAPPGRVDPERAATRREVALRTVTEHFSLQPEQLHFKERRVQRGDAQYERQGTQRRRWQVREGNLSFHVNFTDYLDTGLFIDQRLTRRMIFEQSEGRRVLNLYAYTASASIYAAAGGAASVTSVDLSNTYLQWGRDNAELNGQSERHDWVHAECSTWLDQQHDAGHDWDLIYLDPPSFSNSSSMQGTLDIQRDHASLVHACMRLLTDDGTLLFSTNKRKFKLDADIAARYAVKDLSKATQSPDFARRATHGCWRIGHR